LLVATVAVASASGYSLGRVSPLAPGAHTVAPAVSTLLAPLHDSYEVGAYYFSGWAHGPNNNVSPWLTRTYPQSEPLVGWYDDAQTPVDRSIAQAAAAGINFFAFDWYDVAMSPYNTDQNLNEGLYYYLNSPQRHRLRFCIDYIDQAPFLPPTAARWPQLITQWLGYMEQPDYERVNGKPLFIVFSPEHLRAIFGGPAGVRAALDLLRARARVAGLPGVTIAVDATVAPRINPLHLQELRAEGYDVATGYSYHSLGDEKYRVPVPYSNLVQENAAMWDRVASSLPIPYIPVITSGFDLRYSVREQQTAIIYAGRTPRQFACYALQARHWIDTHPARTTRERVVMVYAWTEMGEGGQIIPTVGDHGAYANALHDIFGGAGRPPGIPAQCEPVVSR